ncbi:MAG: hypothetical protein L0Y71_05500 [Gemmataceae bacterium]|nr:hypothetical protein [Gemmataceae bacterium]
MLAAVVVAPRSSATDPVSQPAVPAGHTYVYLLDGFNPFGSAGMQHLADQLRRAGLPDTRYGGWYRAREFEREIEAVHAADPTARFALIGYSLGAYTARAAANRLLRHGVPLAVVAYIGADYLHDTVETRAPGAQRLVNVTGGGHLLTGRNLLFNGPDVTGARNFRLAQTRHLALPTHPATFAILRAELTAGD